MSLMVEIDGRETDLVAFAANAGVDVHTLRRRLARIAPPYTSTELLTDGRRLNARSRGQQTRDHAKRAAVVALHVAGLSARRIAKAMTDAGEPVSAARVHQLLVSEGYSGSSSGGNGSSSIS
jgi:hypothetical protein